MALLAKVIAFAIVDAFAPNVQPHGPRWITPGAAVAVAVWLLASVAFAVYLRGFSSYGAAYGAFGAAIILLLWLYLTANAFLFGAELDATIEPERAASSR